MTPIQDGRYTITYNALFPDIGEKTFSEDDLVDSWKGHSKRAPPGIYPNVSHCHSTIFFETGAPSLANLQNCTRMVEQLTRCILTFKLKLKTADPHWQNILIKEISKDQAALLHYESSAWAIQNYLLESTAKFCFDSPNGPQNPP